ncbi:hypothetical protein, partial [Flavobacterium pedocola]
MLGGVLCALFMPGNMFSQQFGGLRTAMAVTVQQKNTIQKDPIRKDYQRFVYDNNKFYKESAYTVSTDALPLAGAATPCTAHRWFAGDGWRQNTDDNSASNIWEPIVQSAPSLQPKGIVRCASSAETESGLEVFKGTYVAADNPINAVLPQTDCFSMTTETFGNALARPTDGEEIVWLNFDIRPLAGTYQFQIVTNQNVGFVLFYVDPDSAQPVAGTPGTHYPPTPPGVSGDCSDLVFSDIKIAGISHPACGFSGNGWTTITVPSFKKPTNYYLAMWMADAGVTAFPNNMNLVYKSRFGCGGATCTLEHLENNVVCNGDGTYTVCLDYGGSAGRWNIVDNTGQATNVNYTTYLQDNTTVVATGSSPFTLGTIPDGAVFAKICATYPLGVAYDISLNPDPTFSGGTGYIPCADGDRQTGASPTNPSLTCIGNSLFNEVDCGVPASTAQSNTNADFATWFDAFATANPGVTPTIEYVYTPASANPGGGNHAPLNPGTGVPGFTETSVTVTWTIENSDGCIATCSATFTVT